MVYNDPQKLRNIKTNSVVRGSVVGIATRYGLDGLGFDLRWVQGILSSPHLSRPALGGPPSPL
jgi:hypothetical protein